MRDQKAFLRCDAIKGGDGSVGSEVHLRDALQDERFDCGVVNRYFPTGTILKIKSKRPRTEPETRCIIRSTMINMDMDMDC